MTAHRLGLVAASLLLAACDVSSTATNTPPLGIPEAGPVNDVDAGPFVEHDVGVFDGGAPIGDAGAAETSSVDAGAPACARGDSVLLTDYTSSQIALSGLDGTTLSASFLSSASSATDGLAFAISGDATLPTDTPPSGLVVLVDGYGTDVVTWADPSTGKVLAQLPVGTGFESNPYDYLEVDATHAYVTRWGDNAAKGKQPFDSGSDLLFLDTAAHTIVGSLSMTSVSDTVPPRPAHMTMVNGVVIVALQRISDDFSTYADGRIAGVVPDEGGGKVAWITTITGLKNCDRPTLSPSGKILALACEGGLDMNGDVTSLAQAAVVTFDVTSFPPLEIKRYPISDQLTDGPQTGVAFASDTLLLGKTQTSYGGSSNNQAFSLDLGTGKATSLLTARADATGKGKGIVYGDLRCSPGCANICLMADADQSVLQRWSIGASGLSALAPITVETSVGLPPVGIGGF